MFFRTAVCNCFSRCSFSVRYITQGMINSGIKLCKSVGRTSGQSHRRGAMMVGCRRDMRWCNCIVLPWFIDFGRPGLFPSAVSILLQLRGHLIAARRIQDFPVPSQLGVLVAPTLLVSFAVLILLPGCAFPSRLLKFTLPPIRCDPQDMFLEVGNHWTLVLKANR